ncbi:MAG TPA: hypothetical protein VF574_15205 [Allosphingosinicella sp.]|jgi:hypothetical protein
MSFESHITDSDWAEFRRRRIAEILSLGLPLEAARAATERAERQTRARLEWLSGRHARAAALWARLGAYWSDFAAAHPDIDLVEPDDGDLPLLADPPEQAELEAIEAEIAAARDQDVWPRHLYFGEV